MKLIINTTNLKIGGALQVAISFIYEAINFTENEYHVFLSPTISKEINISLFPDNFTFYNFDNPSRLILFDKTIKLLDKTESEIQPDCVFSIFGPTYWNPKAKHVMGFANALYLYDDLPYIQNMPFFEKLKFNLKKLYHQQLLKNNADLYVVQTEDMKTRFSKFINKSQKVISVVSGKYHSIFEKEIINLKLLPEKKADEFWFVTISSYYPHKKLDIINDIVKKLRIKKLNIKFVLTISDDILKEKFSESLDYIINLGTIKLDECPYVYSSCDALFLPTLIESFTASYPEAMKMKKPILTSDYSFATSVCKDAALYFDPYNIEDIYKQINRIYTDKKLYQEIIELGMIIVEELPSSKKRAEKYIQICKELIDDKKIVIFTKTLWSESPRIRHQLTRLLRLYDHEILFFERSSFFQTKIEYTKSEGIDFVRHFELIHHQLRPFKLLVYLNNMVSKIFIKNNISSQSIDFIINFNYDYDFLNNIFPSNKIITIINDDFIAQGKFWMKSSIKRQLENTCKNSSLVFTIHQSQYRELKRYNKHTYLLYPWAENKYIMPSNLNQKRDVVLFWGFIDHRVNWNLIDELLKKNIKIRFIGHVLVRVKHKIKEYANLDNFELCEPTPLEKINFNDVFCSIIPYNIQIPGVKAISVSNRTFQLLSYGIPVVHTNLPDLIKSNTNVIYKCNNNKDFISGIEHFKNNFYNVQEDIEIFLRNNYKEDRYKYIIDHINKLGT